MKMSAVAGALHLEALQELSSHQQDPYLLGWVQQPFGHGLYMVYTWLNTVKLAMLYMFIYLYHFFYKWWNWRCLIKRCFFCAHHAITMKYHLIAMAQEGAPLWIQIFLPRSSEPTKLGICFFQLSLSPWIIHRNWQVFVHHCWRLCTPRIEEKTFFVEWNVIEEKRSLYPQNWVDVQFQTWQT